MVFSYTAYSCYLSNKFPICLYQFKLCFFSCKQRALTDRYASVYFLHPTKSPQWNPGFVRGQGEGTWVYQVQQRADPPLPWFGACILYFHPNGLPNKILSFPRPGYKTSSSWGHSVTHWVVVHLDNELLHPMQGWVGPWRGIQPVPIQVKPHKRASR